MIKTIKNKLEQRKRSKAWRERNLHNQTTLGNNFRFDCVSVGNATYGRICALAYSENNKLIIGNYCSIASGVVFAVGADHPSNLVSTYPFKVKGLKSQLFEAISKGDIIVEDDVWFGTNSIILSGVRIGQGAIIAAGAVVTKDVPPYAVVGGVPAKIIKYRFTEPVINYMLTLDYGKLDDELVRAHVEELYTKIDDYNINEVKKLFDWFPKKD